MTLSLEQKAAAIRKTCEKIRELHKQQYREICALEVQASLMEQGIDPESVETYGYDPTLDHRKLNGPRIPPQANVINYVRLKGNEDKVILAKPIKLPGVRDQGEDARG